MYTVSFFFTFMYIHACTTTHVSSQTLTVAIHPPPSHMVHFPLAELMWAVQRRTRARMGTQIQRETWVEHVPWSADGRDWNQSVNVGVSQHFTLKSFSSIWLVEGSILRSYCTFSVVANMPKTLGVIFGPLLGWNCQVNVYVHLYTHMCP